MLRIAVITAIALTLAGCATKGGWPCWAWQSGTDQKNEAIGKRMLEEPGK